MTHQQCNIIIYRYMTFCPEHKVIEAHIPAYHLEDRFMKKVFSRVVNELYSLGLKADGYIHELFSSSSNRVKTYNNIVESIQFINTQKLEK